MFSSRKNIEGFQNLFLEFKHYVELQKEFIKLDTAEKITVLLSAIITITVMLILGALVLFFLTFAAAYYIGTTTGSLPLGFTVIALFNLLLLFIFYVNRSRLVLQPLARFLVRLFVPKENGKN